MTLDNPRKGNSTRVIHDGVPRKRAFHSITTPIVHNAPYTFENSDDLNDYMFKRVWGGDTDGRLEYARDGSPTVLAAEQRLAVLEGGDDAALFASGMTALTMLLFSTLKSGDHLILTDDSYRHSREFCHTYLKRFGVTTTIVPIGDEAAMENAIRPGETQYILTESPTNPCLRLVDFERLAAIARPLGVKTIVDSTFGTPINQQPLAAGIDYVWHSVTKYLGGHHDLLAGVIIGNKKDIAELKAARVMLGGVIAPETAYLIERGLRTLSVRMDRHNANAQAIAEFLEGQAAIERVWYPGLESHPDHALATQQMSGYGGVVSFEVRGGLEKANQLCDLLEIPYLAVSLGGVESLICSPAIMAYYELEPEDRAAIGVKDNMLRYAVGLEDADDLIADLAQALDQL